MELWLKVLSLMATYTGDGPQYFKPAAEIDQILKKRRRTQETSSEGAYPQVHKARSASRDAGQPFRRCVRPVHTFQGKRKAHVGVSCDLLLVLSRRYCVITVLTRGIAP